MCARVYLKGNGSGRSTHMSVYLIIMPGEYDTLLEWPCKLQVIFCLHNFTNNEDHIIKSFQSSANFQCFQKPNINMNMPIGFPKFVCLSKIQQENSPYVQNGLIFIKIMIRDKFLPQSNLRKIMSIDPALPIYKQDELIEQYSKQYKLICTLK